MVPDIPTIPTIEVKKKKVPWWKRVLVFALGVLQICIGALIVASTAGAAAEAGTGAAEPAVLLGIATAEALESCPMLAALTTDCIVSEL